MKTYCRVKHLGRTRRCALFRENHLDELLRGGDMLKVRTITAMAPLERASQVSSKSQHPFHNTADGLYYHINDEWPNTVEYISSDAANIQLPRVLEAKTKRRLSLWWVCRPQCVIHTNEQRSDVPEVVAANPLPPRRERLSLVRGGCDVRAVISTRVCSLPWIA